MVTLSGKLTVSTSFPGSFIFLPSLSLPEGGKMTELCLAFSEKVLKRFYFYLQILHASKN